MAKNVKLLLVENVEALGIVGDVVSVRTGYARNFLMPRELATVPTDEKIKELSSKRAEAEKQLALLRKQREALLEKLKGVEVSLIRSCNDQGILYGAITQQDVSKALNEMGHGVKPRDVRITQVIKRIDSYTVHVKLDSDLDTEIKLWVVADRKLDLEKAGAEAAHAEKSAEGAAAGAGGAGGAAPGAEGATGEKTAEGGQGGGERRERRDRPERDRDRDRGDRGDRRGNAMKAALEAAMASSTDVGKFAKRKDADTGEAPAAKAEGKNDAKSESKGEGKGGKGEMGEKKSKKKD